MVTSETWEVEAVGVFTILPTFSVLSKPPKMTSDGVTWGALRRSVSSRKPLGLLRGVGRLKEDRPL